MRHLVFLIIFAAPSICLADDKADLDKLSKDLKAKDGKTRLKALKGVGEMGEKAAPLARDLCSMMVNDPVPAVAIEALAIMERIRPDLYKPISDYLLDKNGQVVENAIDTLSKMGEKAGPVLPILHNRLKAQVALVTNKNGTAPATIANLNTVMNTIKSIDAEDAEMIKAQKQLADTRNPNTETRGKALADLMRWAGEDKDRRKQVYPLVKGGLGNITLITKCCEYVGSNGDAAKDAIPILKKLKMHELKNIREAAAAALLQIEN
jgi:HEAT repeat protein